MIADLRSKDFAGATLSNDLTRLREADAHRVRPQ